MVVVCLVLQIVAEIHENGATGVLAPLGVNGTEMLLASRSKMSIVEATWAMYSAANAIALGIQLNSSSAAPAVCSAKASAPWTLVANALSGNQVRRMPYPSIIWMECNVRIAYVMRLQLHEDLASSIKLAFTYVRDARSGLVDKALIIFCVMISAIFMSGKG